MSNDGIQKIIEYLPRLEDRVENGFAQVDARFENVAERFDEIDERFTKIDARFDQVDQSIELLHNSVIELHDDHEKRIVKLEDKAGFPRFN